MRTPMLLPLALLREPAHAARTSMDDKKLLELAESIKANGVLQRLIVGAERDGVHEIAAGHRRYKAALMAGLTQVPVEVEDDAEALTAVKVHENLARENWSPADEAVFYRELLEGLGGDTDILAHTVKKSRDYVEKRLALLLGDADVFKALQERTISLGTAEALNRLTKHDDCVYFLDAAVRGGATLSIVKRWVADANARHLMEQRQAAGLDPAGVGPGGAPLAPAPVYRPAYQPAPHELTSDPQVRTCLFCKEPSDGWKMFVKHVCKDCADEYCAPGKPLADPLPGGPQPV